MKSEEEAPPCVDSLLGTGDWAEKKATDGISTKQTAKRSPKSLAPQ